MKNIYIIGSNLFKFSFCELLRQEANILTKRLSQCSSLKYRFDLVIVEFPRNISMVERYREEINSIRDLNRGVKILFMHAKTTPLLMAIIYKTQPDQVLSTKANLDKINYMCKRLLYKKQHLECITTPTSTPMLTNAELKIVITISAHHDLIKSSEALNINKKTLYSHLNNINKKFNIKNRVDFFKCIS